MSAAKQEVAISISWLIFRVVLQRGDREAFGPEIKVILQGNMEIGCIFGLNSL